MPLGGRAWYTDEGTLVWLNPVLRTTPSPCVILCCSIIRAESVGSLRQVQLTIDRTTRRRGGGAGVSQQGRPSSFPASTPPSLTTPCRFPAFENCAG